MRNNLLNILPEELCTTAGALNQLSINTDMVQQSLSRAWTRLDAGWDTYAEASLTGYYNEALEEVNRMAAMLNQMGEAFHMTANTISQADRSIAIQFTEENLTSLASGGGGKPLLYPMRQGDPPIPPTLGEDEIEALREALIEVGGEYREILKKISFDGLYLVDGEEVNDAVTGAEVIVLLEEVEFVVGPPPDGFPGSGTGAAWNPEDGRIYINPEKCAGMSDEALMAILIHEVVHGVQQNEFGPYDEAHAALDCGPNPYRNTDDNQYRIEREYVAYSFQSAFWDKVRGEAHNDIANLPPDHPDQFVEVWYSDYDQGILKDQVAAYMRPNINCQPNFEEDTISS